MMNYDVERVVNMALVITNKLKINVTMVSNEFIDKYMPIASGEYVKVYLYLLRHESDDIQISDIADALNYTEADVNRALSYWNKQGALNLDSPGIKRDPDVQTAIAAQEKTTRRKPVSSDQLEHLSDDEEFKQLIYIVQKYLNKVFNQRECEVFAYLYGALHMSVDLLEYLVEYCVQGGHTSLRYIETVALNWHEKGIKTADMARNHAESFSKDIFLVMKTFGLSDRKPGTTEKEYIETWFRTYGFTKEIVLEACNRTMETIHNPSFRYTDKILSDWKKQGVRTLADVENLDKKYQGRKASKTPSQKAASNQFHNFDQRKTDYDAMILQDIREQ